MCIGKCKYTIHESIMGKYNYRAPGSRRLSEVLLSDPSDFVGGINCFDGHNEPRQVRHDRLWDAAVFFGGKNTVSCFEVAGNNGRVMETETRTVHVDMFLVSIA